MRIAFSGTHRAGKSTLVERVAERLPGYATVDEPYHLLAEDGYEVAEHPSIEDFEAQLERAIASLDGDRSPDLLFDRCPVDLLAYLLTHDAGGFDPEGWLDAARDAMQTLDLVVLVPVETRDRIALPAHEDRAWRLAVHLEIEELLADDPFGFDSEVLRVHGDVESRVRQVMARVRSG
ncbi:MAG TPA: AAA family ATPase [Kofleriaceae bacterium]|nr:AAA family ATPase [Kofleriaceae bacterium]